MLSQKNVNMAATELAWTVVFVFGIGILAGWAVFGHPRLIDRAAQNSSIADWLAAIGTWVIGYGAIKYARDSHVHRIEEAKAQARRDRLIVRSKLTGFIERAARATGARRVLRLYAAKPAKDQTAVTLYVAIDVTLNVTTSIGWNEADEAYLDDKLIVELSELKLILNQYNHTAIAVKGLLSETDTSALSPSLQTCFTSLKEVADEMHDMAKLFCRSVVAYRET